MFGTVLKLWSQLAGMKYKFPVCTCRRKREGWRGGGGGGGGGGGAREGKGGPE